MLLIDFFPQFVSFLSPAVVKRLGSASRRVRRFTDTIIPSFPTVRFEGLRYILVPVVEAAMEEPPGN